MTEEKSKSEYSKQILKLDGPILVTGAGGFIGAALLKALLAIRSDVYGIVRKPNWRLLDVEPVQLRFINL